MWHDAKEVASEPRTVPRCFSLYMDAVMTLQTPSEGRDPRASSVQVSTMEGTRACTELMVNNADPSSRQVGIPLLWQKFCFGGSSQVSIFCTPTAVRTTAYVSSAFEYDIAPETAGSCRRPPKTLLEHLPKKTAFTCSVA